MRGIRIRKTLVQPSSTNPFILRDDTGEEKPATKEWTDNVPISVADSEVEEALVTVGCELRSPIKLERARDADKKLTRFLTGRRFLFVTVPPRPLEKSLRVNIFTAKLYHKEQKQVTAFCLCCLTQGHYISVCTNEIVCRECKEAGHKRGDTECDLGQNSKEKNNNTGSRGARTDGKSKGGEGKSVDRPKKDDRGRTSVRQTTLQSTLDLHSTRSRSETPKCRRSGEGTSPNTVQVQKQARRDHGANVRNPSPHTRRLPTSNATHRRGADWLLSTACSRSRTWLCVMDIE